MVRRRAYNNAFFGTLEYMQYIDYALQLQPNQSDLLVREGLNIDSSLDEMALVTDTKEAYRKKFLYCIQWAPYFY